jgi:hypothetical protein
VLKNVKILCQPCHVRTPNYGARQWRDRYGR